jgi:hypothetical protein
MEVGRESNPGTGIAISCSRNDLLSAGAILYESLANAPPSMRMMIRIGLIHEPVMITV